MSETITGLSPAADQAGESRALELLRKSGAMLEGHFLLSSGRHSDRYFQCARLLQYPDRAAAALADVARRIRVDMDSGRLVLDAVAGPAIGGIIAAWELGRQLGLPAVFTERDETGKMILRRGFEAEEKRRFLIAEDVITTGKSWGECAAALKSRGNTAAALACVVDRRSGGGEAAETDLPLYAACRVEAQTWDAASCELCGQGSSPVKPGSRSFR